MSQTSTTDIIVNSDLSAHVTAAWVEKWLSDFSNRVGKVWPLQTVNACNPLAAYEHLPFQTALDQAMQELDFSSEVSLSVFKRLYQEQAFTDQDIEAVLAADEHLWLNHTIDYQLEKITYRKLLLIELQAALKKGDSGQSTEKRSHLNWPAEAEQALERAISIWCQDHMPTDELHSGPCISIHPRHMTWINEQAVKWLAAYMDEGQAAWTMPGKQQSFRQAWRDLVVVDGQIPRGMKAPLNTLISQWIQPNLPAIEAIAQLGIENGLNASQLAQWMDTHLRQLPGWAGYIHYCQSNDSHASTLLADYLLTRLLYHLAGAPLDWGPMEADSSNALAQNVSAYMKRLQALYDSALSQSISCTVFTDNLRENLPAWMAYCNTVTPGQQLTYLMAALEHSQQTPLAARLAQAFSNESSSTEKHAPDAQAVFCIDVRSEPYRKHLETMGAIQTYGFAGFFGLPIARVPYAGAEPVSLCPVLLEPKYHIPEAPPSMLKQSVLTDWLRQGVHSRHQWIYALKKIKREPFTTFSYVEGFGLVHAFTMLKDSFASLPLGRLHQNLQNRIQSLLGLKPQLHMETQGPNGQKTGIPLPDQIELAKGTLKMMGLRQPYAEFVIVCGHEAQAYNNAYASSLDCGACGANGGGFNALALCQLLNQPEVREALEQQGIHIPERTRFIAAVHNTTTDTVRFLNPEIMSSEQQARFKKIQAIFEEATIRNRLARQQRLKQHAVVSSPFNLVSVSYDWSQTRPEWGLSKNQAFIIGDRETTRSLDLEGRCFLHSYDWQSDMDASVLTMIMTAPLVVGAWINLQYDFSTLDAQRFGSGPKYLHNPVGLFGTYLGNASDLQVGLPYESLFANDGSPYHYPQRLSAFITAPLSRVQAIIQSHSRIRDLIHNEWIHLTVFDPETKTTVQFQQGFWQAVTLG